MSTVVMHAVVSVDGFIADAHDEVGPLFDWYGNGDTEIAEGSGMYVSQISAGYVQPMWAGIGSMVIGRRLFDQTNGWNAAPPAGEHVVVVSHRPRRLPGRDIIIRRPNPPVHRVLTITGLDHVCTIVDAQRLPPLPGGLTSQSAP